MIQPFFMACDHAGFELKEHLKSLFFANSDFELRDMGTGSLDPVDYPDIIHRTAIQMKATPEAKGVFICGSGNGVCITANRYSHLRAALAWKVEIARLARQHNNANVLCLPARFISFSEAENCLWAFLNTPFEGGRHEIRVAKINPILEN
jgi:ribose 5-phosphate isomerase B